ncbi:Aminoacyl-tRNA synthetase, class Ic [Carpediemonas membranifera]|uniref:Tryptophan--tRNA ligase, cytoplasmic n=1 Tax=Carpediemonas membranifera TaxID=201153 RepID=A0A8J6C0A6_9EUKA|nr:Aminoacyl-tRNA synthetase, class Ic [Carpediemonas membranifera]|eukprot:KAG9396381.1 Aminoacyl-tRNA synthetase, class Ic [Carpediemonas membranifera]
MAETDKKEQVVTPWDVSAEDQIDYNKLINDFGSQRIDAALLEKFAGAIDVPLHQFLTRGIFFSHRDMNQFLTNYIATKAGEAKNAFYLYTGRGPSSGSLHMGHLVPMRFTKWLQDALDIPLVIQLTDDEKFLWRDIEFDTVRQLAIDNAKDIIACGFNPERTFIFRDSDYYQDMYETILSCQRATTMGTSKAAFGFTEESNIGKASFPPVQAAPSFPTAFPHIFGKDLSKKAKGAITCLIPCAIDQDPYFRLSRDYASKLGCNKPALLHSVFLPSLAGAGTKMSASATDGSIFVTDSMDTIKAKIEKVVPVAETVAEAGDDVSLEWLKFFLEDDAEFNKLCEDRLAGAVSGVAIRDRLVAVLQDMAAEFQARRAAVTDEDVEKFFSKRSLY